MTAHQPEITRCQAVLTNNQHEAIAQQDSTTRCIRKALLWSLRPQMVLRGA
jgi:hypothetical protein